ARSWRPDPFGLQPAIDRVIVVITYGYSLPDGNAVCPREGDRVSAVEYVDFRERGVLVGLDSSGKDRVDLRVIDDPTGHRPEALHDGLQPKDLDARPGG